MTQIDRRKSIKVMVGDIAVGGGAPVVVQSMTNTDTADVTATAAQVKQLNQADSVMVRTTFNNKQATQAVPHIQEHVIEDGGTVPLVGDFHYNGHKLLVEYPEAARALAKFRINPGNT